MKTRSIALVSWLVVGHAVIGGLYWLLLQVPESNALMLAASALIAICIVIDLGIVNMLPPRAAAVGEPMGRALRAVMPRAWLVVFPLLVFGFFWWLSGIGDDWSSAHAGEMDAWIIAKLGWTSTAWLHKTIDIVLSGVRYVLGLALAASLLSALAIDEVKGLTGGWIGNGLRWRFLLMVAAAAIVGFALPSFALYWRPASLPPTWMQPAFASVKLFVLFVVANAAWAFILLKARRPSA